MTFKAKVSGLSAFRHSTTVENSPSPNLLSTSYGPTHVSVSNLSAATDGGRASCWAQVDSRSVGLPVACSARGRIFLSILLMLGQLQWRLGSPAQAAPAACLIPGQWSDVPRALTRPAAAAPAG